MSSTVNNSRALEAALAPLMGPCAGGSVLVKSTGATGTVPFGAALIPIVRGAMIEGATAFVTKNPATEDGSWPVVQAGSSVPIAALQGGIVGNTPAGTQYRWDPPLEGIELTSVSAAGLSAGVANAGYAALKQLRPYKGLAQNELDAFLRAQLGQFPGVMIAWESTQPIDGPMAAKGVPRAARAGVGKMWYRHNWLFYVVTSRLDSEGQRRREGDTLRNDIEETLLDTTQARGLRVSMEPGAEVVESRLFTVSPTSYVDLIRISTTVTLQHRRQTANYNDWLRTRLRQQTDPNGEGPAISPPLDLPDVTDPMPPAGSP